MMRLDDREWGTFYVGDLFTVKRPAARNKDDYQEGAVPFVASGSVNNGVMKCCQPLEDEVLDAAGCITVSPVDGSAFYQPYPFLGRGGAGSSVLMLYKDGINLYIGQFIARMVANTCVGKYTYGHMGNKDSIKRERILLPVTDDGEPDYQFMEDYIRELIAEKKKQYRRYVKQRIAALCAGPCDQQVDWKSMIDSHDWEPFQIDTIFNILPGKRLVAADSTPGDRPFIGALDNSNGVARFVSDKNESLDKNVLGVNYNGNGMVIGFYHPYECIFSDDVKRFHLKDREDDPFVLLFMKTAILMQKQKFGYLYKFNADRMAHTSIMLPVTDAGQPDYDFMESFGRKMMSNKYNQYLAFLAMSDTIKA